MKLIGRSEITRIQICSMGWGGNRALVGVLEYVRDAKLGGVLFLKQ